MFVSTTFFVCRIDQYVEELKNEELNRQLCAVAADEMFESWSPEIQEQVLAEWDDWRNEKSRQSCEQCGKNFARFNGLKRHVRRVHMGEKLFQCHKCDKSFSTSDMLKRHDKTYCKKSVLNVKNVIKYLEERCVYRTILCI